MVWGLVAVGACSPNVSGDDDGPGLSTIPTPVAAATASASAVSPIPSEGVVTTDLPKIGFGQTFPSRAAGLEVSTVAPQVVREVADSQADRSLVGSDAATIVRFDLTISNPCGDPRPIGQVELGASVAGQPTSCMLAAPFDEGIGPGQSLTRSVECGADKAGHLAVEVSLPASGPLVVVSNEG